jgi:hypothetical protein
MIAKLIAEILVLKRQVSTTVSDNYAESLKELPKEELVALRDSYQEELKSQPGWYDFA